MFKLISPPGLVMIGHLLLCVQVVFSQNSSDRPNVVLILVDDLGWADLGYMGSQAYETPNVDRLASEGMVFSDFYAGGPVCSPTRASILTGKSTARTGITTFLITPDQDAPYVTHELPLTEWTLAEALRKNGYRTGIFGKWHLGYEMKHWASNQGFDVAIGGTTSRNAWRLAHPEKEPPLDQLEVSYFSPHHLTHMENGPEGEYLTDRLTDETIDFIKQSRQRPFFAFLSFHTVHTPLEAKKSVIEKYRKKFEHEGTLNKDDAENGSKKYQNIPEYAAMVQHMDENVGRLLKELDALDLSKNTIVIFTSDNGGKHTVTSNAPLRGAKHNLYEGGIRIPAIIRYPERVQPGSRSGIPLITDDLYPTLLDMCNLPLEKAQHLDGRSFRKIVFRQNSKPVHKALFWHYPHLRFEGAVRWKNYKLVYEYKTGLSELYDLSSDIGERQNIAGSHPEIVSTMKKMLGRWFQKTGARFPDEGIILPGIKG